MTDRPISLEAVLEAMANCDRIGINTHNVVAELLRALPTFTPDDPAEARRRLTESAREWSGPDRWQVWHGARASQPDNNPDKYGEPPDGFTPIGPWKFVAVYETSDCGPASVWERPLRKVSP